VERLKLGEWWPSQWWTCFGLSPFRNSIDAHVCRSVCHPAQPTRSRPTPVAGDRCQSARGHGMGDTRPGASPATLRPGRRHDPRDGEDRGFRSLLERLFQPRALRSEGSMDPRVRTFFGIPTRTTGSGWSSTGMTRAGRTSCPTPMSRRSFKKVDCKVSQRRLSSSGRTTPNLRPNRTSATAPDAPKQADPTSSPTPITAKPMRRPSGRHVSRSGRNVSVRPFWPL
jgi:hypothetical protein